jgi:hypothetical protein
MGRSFGKKDPMKAYVATTGIVFGLIVLAHIAKLFADDLHPAKDPVFVVLTVIAAGLALWAFRVFRKSPRT